MIFQGSGGGLSDLFGGFTNFVTAMLALSVASERVTETIKQFLNPLEGMGKASKAQQGAGQTGTAQQGKTSDFLGKWFAWLSSDWATQGIAILSGIIRRSEFSVTLTVISFLVPRSLSVIFPAVASTLAISPERSRNAPLTTSSACTCNPSADFFPRACNWSFA